MKIMCLERDNTTYQSTDDEAGHSYRSSFELYPFHEGKDHAVFKGMLNGRGPKRGMFCAVKAHVTRAANEMNWNSVVHNSQTGRKMAALFNQCLKRRSVCFTQPLVAQMNRVSDFNGVMKIFQPHEKKLKQKEYVVLEDFIEGKFERFSSASGASTDTREADMTQAFTHFTWHHTREFVICGLQGVNHNGVYELTSPAIHSVSGQFGASDCRFPGIVEFFSHHHCNNICCSWDTPFKPTPYPTHPAGVNTTLINYLPPTAPPVYYTY